jgi:hypothetical protein
LYQQGVPISKIAAAFNLHHSTAIRHHLIAEGVFIKDRQIARYKRLVPQIIKEPYQEAIKKVVDIKLPPHIQQIYIKMHKEDESARHHIPKFHSKRYIPHKHILADLPKDIPFKAMYSFPL